MASISRWLHLLFPCSEDFLWDLLFSLIPPQKPTLLNLNLIWKQWNEKPLYGCAKCCFRNKLLFRFNFLHLHGHILMDLCFTYITWISRMSITVLLQLKMEPFLISSQKRNFRFMFLFACMGHLKIILLSTVCVLFILHFSKCNIIRFHFIIREWL